MIAMNLIPAARLDARIRRRRVRGWAVAGGGYLCVLAAACLVCQATWGRPDPAAAEEAARLDLEIKEADRRVAALHPELAEAHLRLRAGRAVAVQPDWSVLLALLNEARGDRIVLDRCALSRAAPLPDRGAGRAKGAGPEAAGGAVRPPGPTDFRLEISGLGRSQDDVLRFVRRLEGLGLFDRVRPPETRRRPFGAGHAVAFELECRIGGK